MNPSDGAGLDDVSRREWLRRTLIGGAGFGAASYLGACAAMRKKGGVVNPIEDGKVRIIDISEEHHIIGPDDRRPVENTTETPKQAVSAEPDQATALLLQASTFLPYQAIARLEVTQADNKLTYGTGFYFRDRRTIVTAAHVLRPRSANNSGRLAKSVRIFTAQNGASQPFPVRVSTTFKPHDSWVSPPGGSPYWHFDFGVIKLPRMMIEPFEGTPFPSTTVNGTLCGYPVAKTPPFKQWSGEGELALALGTDRVIGHRADASNGQSGSPIWVKQNGVAKVVAIHSRGSTDPTWNVGVKFTNEVQNWVVSQYPNF